MLLPQEIEKPRPDAPRGSGCRRLAGLSEPWVLELSETTFGNAASGQVIIGLTPASGATEHVDTRVGKEEDADAPRRLYYVGMTRARQTLALMRLPDPNPFQDALSNAPSTLFRSGPASLPAPAPELARSYRFHHTSLSAVTQPLFTLRRGYRSPARVVRDVAGLDASIGQGHEEHGGVWLEGASVIQCVCNQESWAGRHALALTKFAFMLQRTAVGKGW